MTNENVNVNARRRGYATSEFWVLLAVLALTVVQARIGVIDPAYASGAAVILATAYTASRTVIKAIQGGTGDSGADGKDASPPPATGQFPRAALMVFILCSAIFSVCGCQASATLGQPSEAVGPVLFTVASDVGGAELLGSIQNAAQRQDAARAMYGVGQALYAAAQSPPDYSALESIVSASLNGWSSPYAPLVGAIARQAIARAQSQAGTQANPQAAAFVQGVALGLELAATSSGYVPAPPASQPAVVGGAVGGAP